MSLTFFLHHCASSCLKLYIWPCRSSFTETFRNVKWVITISAYNFQKKSRTPTSLCSSLRSDDDKVTVQYIPPKVSTADAAVSTDPIFMDNQSVEKIEVGVNTIIEMGSNIADGSSSSNTTSDNSAGQLPKRLFDTVLQRLIYTGIKLGLSHNKHFSYSEWFLLV